MNEPIPLPDAADLARDLVRLYSVPAGYPMGYGDWRCIIRRAVAAEAEVKSIHKLIQDRGWAEKDCTLSIDQRIDNRLLQMSQALVDAATEVERLQTELAEVRQVSIGWAAQCGRLAAKLERVAEQT